MNRQDTSSGLLPSFLLTFCTLFSPFSPLQRLWIQFALRKWLQQETFSSLILKGVRGRARKPNSYVAAWATVLATSWATRSCWATRARASKVQLWPPSRTHSAPLLMLFKFSWCSSAKKTCANWIHPRKTNWKKLDKIHSKQTNWIHPSRRTHLWWRRPWCWRGRCLTVDKSTSHYPCPLPAGGQLRSTRQLCIAFLKVQAKYVEQLLFL